jgi:hypothetical protein
MRATYNGRTNRIKLVSWSRRKEFGLILTKNDYVDVNAINITKIESSSNNY